MTTYSLSSHPIPLYFQLKESIRKKIIDKIYLPGEIIPAEPKLQDEYNVSRETVRRAIRDLVLEGLLVKSRGVGTYVAQPKIIHRIGSIYGSTEELLARGMKPGTHYLEKREIVASEEIRREMNLHKETKVFKVKRLRLADNEPMAILTSYLNKDLVPNLLSVTFKDDSLYRTLEEIYHLTLHECDEIIEAAMIEGRDANLLGLGKSGPVLVVKRMTYLDNLKVIEKLIAFYRSDKFKYQVKLRGRSEGRLL
ncbi:MAG: GntR family transcriptional regulator [Deltaproteobacteria bacterium]|nr:GntR family transcriptional regulator [Deltaproteobacteria bacterium]